MSYTKLTPLTQVVELDPATVAKILPAAMAGLVTPALAAQAKYGINAWYILAHAAWESGWGKSRISQIKHNWYGWNAVDVAPYADASAFKSDAACVDYVMGRIKVLYLSTRGKYYRGECLGQGGPKGFGMNRYYATDVKWGAGIAGVMNSLEAKYAAALAPSK